MAGIRVKKIKAQAVLKNLEKLIDFTISAARSAGGDDEKISDVHLAVDEACTNIINYAYPKGEEGEIEITCSLSKTSFLVRIRDWGRPFDPTKTPPPDLELDLDHRPIGGLGIFLMKKFSDELRFRRENNSNCLEIVKYL
jgi:serine/threonine-protein kinase RsbW